MLAAVWLIASIFILVLAALLFVAQIRGLLSRSKMDAVIIYIAVLFFVFISFTFFSQAFATETEPLDIWGSLYSLSASPSVGLLGAY